MYFRKDGTIINEIWEKEVKKCFYETTREKAWYKLEPKQAVEKNSHIKAVVQEVIQGSIESVEAGVEEIVLHSF